MENLIEYDTDNLWHPYAPLPASIPNILVKHAKGVYLYTNYGKLIDGMSSWWCALHGYNHHKLNQALIKQANKFAHVMFGGLTHAPAIELAKILKEISGFNKVFFTDSGSNSIEVAQKIALQYFKNKNLPKKTKFISLYNAYHGDTFAAMSICDPVNSMHKYFKDNIFANFFVRPPSFNFSLTDAITELENTLQANHDKVAAIFMEPIVQNAGGIKFYPPEYLSAARKISRKYEVLLVLDEIATGFGRTGKLFASEWAKVKADLVCLGKAITAGYMSFAAVLIDDAVASVIHSGSLPFLMHGPTFMANPLACAVAKAQIELLLNSNWQLKVQKIEHILKQNLGILQQNKYKALVKDVRIMGAIGAVELNDNALAKINTINQKQLALLNITLPKGFSLSNYLQAKVVEQNVWLRPFNNLLYTMPPFIISAPELKLVCDAMINAINDLMQETT